LPFLGITLIMIYSVSHLLGHYSSLKRPFYGLFQQLQPIFLTNFGKCMPLEIELFFFLVISENTFQHRTQRFHFHFFHHEIDLIVHNFDSFFHFLIMYLAEHSSKKSAD